MKPCSDVGLFFAIYQCETSGFVTLPTHSPAAIVYFRF